jgi:hypothetical protein
MARLVRPIVAVTAVAGLLLTSATPVAAECDPPGADPSFRRAVPYAPTVVVGRVVATAPDGLSPAGGPSFRFTLAVDQVLRGRSTSVIEVDHLQTGGCVRWLSAAIGDRIALAMHADGADPSIAANSAAWIVGTPPLSTGFESITLAEVLDLVHLAAPDTSTAAAASDGTAFGPIPTGLITAVAAIWLAVRLDRTTRRRRRRVTPLASQTETLL